MSSKEESRSIARDNRKRRAARRMETKKASVQQAQKDVAISGDLRAARLRPNQEVMGRGAVKGGLGGGSKGGDAGFNRGPAVPGEDRLDRGSSEKRQEQPSKGVFAAFSEERKKKAEQRRRSKTKAKAERKFNAAYGSSNAAPPSEAGPRAAVYEGKMGSSHRKSSKMQSKPTAPVDPGIIGAALGSVSKGGKPKFSRHLVRLLCVAAIAVVLCVGLYGPAQEYYIQMRETARLQAEYIEVSQRTNNIASSIDSLQSDEGIEDKAHTDFGYVKEGEKTATVKGVTTAELQKELPTANVAPGSIPAPETWYSPMFDALFGYQPVSG